MKGFSVFGRRLLALTRGETAPVQVLSDGLRELRGCAEEPHARWWP